MLNTEIKKLKPGIVFGIYEFVSKSKRVVHEIFFIMLTKNDF